MTLRYQRSQLFARANPLSKLAIATLFIAALMVGITSQNAFAQGADGSLNFYFVTLASAGEMDGVNHFMTMTGSGRFNADLVEGGGAYQFFDANTEVPRTLLGSGQWQAVRVINWSMVEGDNPNPYGVNAAGVLDLEILMFPLDEGGEGTPATLRIVVQRWHCGTDDGPSGRYRPRNQRWAYPRADPVPYRSRGGRDSSHDPVRHHLVQPPKGAVSRTRQCTLRLYFRLGPVFPGQGG